MTRDQFWTEALLRALTGTAANDLKAEQLVQDAAAIADYALAEMEARKLLTVPPWHQADQANAEARAAAAEAVADMRQEEENRRANEFAAAIDE